MQEEKERCTTCACWYSLLFIVIRENIYSRMILVREEWLRKRRSLYSHFKSWLLCHWLKCVTSKMLSRGNNRDKMPNRTIIISFHFALFNIDVSKHDDVVKCHMIFKNHIDLIIISVKTYFRVVLFHELWYFVVICFMKSTSF